MKKRWVWVIGLCGLFLFGQESGKIVPRSGKKFEAKRAYIAGLQAKGLLESQSPTLLGETLISGGPWWEAIGPAGGGINSLVANPQNQKELYAVSHSKPGQVYKSTDSGETWSRIALLDDDTRCIALDPAVPSTIYVSSYLGVFKSTNGGANWEQFKFGSNSYATNAKIAINPNNTAIIYVAGEYTYISDPSYKSCMAVFKSTDGGKNWTALKTSTETGSGISYGLALDPKNPDTIYLAGYDTTSDGFTTSGRLYKSVNGGTSWTNIKGAIEGIPVAVAVDPNVTTKVYAGNTSGIFKSINGGSNWAEAGSAAASEIVVDPVYSNKIYAGWIDSFYSSTNEGASWTLSTSVLKGECRSLLYTSVLNSGTPTTALLFASDQGVFKSLDGVVWKASGNGISAVSVPAIAHAPSSPNIVYCAVEGDGLFKSVNYGISWTRLPDFSGCGAVIKIFIYPENPNGLFALVDGEGLDVFLKSEDGGTNWTEVYTDYFNDFDVDPENLLHIVLAGQSYSDVSGAEVVALFETLDGGMTWTDHELNAEDGIGLCVVFEPKNAGTVYVGAVLVDGDSGALFKSIDGGASWDLVLEPTFGVYSIAVDPITPDLVYAGTPSGVYKSSLSGALGSWKKLGTFDVNVIKVRPSTEGIGDVFAAGAGGVHFSQYGGSTWLDYNRGLPSGLEVMSLDLEPAGLILFAGTEGFGAYRSFVSPLLPRVDTSAVSNITPIAADCGGNVLSDGGLTVTSRGVCWGPTPNPTTADAHTTNGSGTGEFTSHITDLYPGMLYHVRAYARNSAGTAYGNDLTFTTQVVDTSTPYFVIPFGSLDNGNINLANIGTSTANVTLKVLDNYGAIKKEQGFTLPVNGVKRTWDVIGNIYGFGKPVTVEVFSAQALVGDNIKWAGPPYDTVGAGFTCAPVAMMKGKLFYFPFSSFGWANAYCVITNTSGSTAAVTIEVFDQNGISKKSAVFTIPGRGIVRSWDYLGSIQEIADPALLKVVSSEDVVMEAVRWEQNKRGWGFAILPSALGAGTSFLIPFGSLDNGNVNIANIGGAAASVTVKVLDAAGVAKKTETISIPANGVKRTWDVIGNIFDYGKPLTVEISSAGLLVADNVKWANAPYDTVGAGFTCAPMSLTSGKLFYLPFSSFGWTNGYCVIANTTSSSAAVTIDVYDKDGVLKKTVNFTVDPKAVVRSWDNLGSIQAVADPALLRISSSQNIVVEAVKWEENRRGWGFALLPIGQ